MMYEDAFADTYIEFYNRQPMTRNNEVSYQESTSRHMLATDFIIKLILNKDVCPPSKEPGS